MNSSKRRKYDTTGIGHIGVLLLQAFVLLGEKIMAKACVFCKKFVRDPDELDDSLTYAWNKPDYAGKVGRAAISDWLVGQFVTSMRRRPPK